jgi:endonuclease YncB( thermonuclease family)
VGWLPKTKALALPGGYEALAQNFPTISGTATVKDGDSLMIGGLEVRLHGIDAPELDQTCKDAVSPPAAGGCE